ncbi:hypothetical protein B0H10DRAFT_695665 [Mycena sp. CBHHK59/15]|nr:hypothetical protein B0H10DRAFT_695665 [Mycena sp. CBHHK59/15]
MEPRRIASVLLLVGHGALAMREGWGDAGRGSDGRYGARRWDIWHTYPHRRCAIPQIALYGRISSCPIRTHDAARSSSSQSAWGTSTAMGMTVCYGRCCPFLHTALQGCRARSRTCISSRIVCCGLARRTGAAASRGALVLRPRAAHWCCAGVLSVAHGAPLPASIVLCNMSTQGMQMHRRPARGQRSHRHPGRSRASRHPRGRLHRQARASDDCTRR